MLNVPAVVTVLILLAVAGVILNGLCIYIIFASASLRKKASTLFILNLLTLHFMQSLFVFPFYALKKYGFEDFLVDKVVSNGWRISYMISFYATVLGILFISIDRFLATFLLANYKSKVTKKRVKIALICLWIYTFIMCSIPFFNQEKYAKTLDDGSVELIPSKYIYQPQKQWVIFMLSINTVLPYIIIILSYAYIIAKLQKLDELHSKYAAVAATQHRRMTLQERFKKNSLFKQKDLKKYEQVTRLTIVLAVLYGLLWTPSVLYYIILESCPSCFAPDWEDSYTEQVVGFTIKFFAFLDAVAAPLVYCFLHGEFRKGLKRLRSSLLRQEQSVEIMSSAGETTAMV